MKSPSRSKLGSSSGGPALTLEVRCLECFTAAALRSLPVTLCVSNEAGLKRTRPQHHASAAYRQLEGSKPCSRSVWSSTKKMPEMQTHANKQKNISTPPCTVTP